MITRKDKCHCSHASRLIFWLLVAVALCSRSQAEKKVDGKAGTQNNSQPRGVSAAR
jgi:hypothetical protein